MMKKQSVTLFDLRSAAASALSLAVKQLFPSALLAGSKVTPTGFYCDFSLSTSFNSECMRQVEEVLQAWIRQKLQVEVREMVSLSAKEYFLFHKEPLLAKKIEESEESTFFLTQILGKMTLSSSSEPLQDLGQIGAFSLQSLEKVGKRVRIYGTAFFDKQELKNFLKIFESYSSHLILGDKESLFEEGEDGQILWLPKGQEVRSILKNIFETEEEKFQFKRVSSIPVSEEVSHKIYLPFHQKVFEREKKHGTVKISECATFCPLIDSDLTADLLDASFFEGVRFHIFCSKKDLLDELISYLHFMTKIFKILDFAFRPIFFEVRKGKFQEASLLFAKALEQIGTEVEVQKSSSGFPRIEWNVADGLGRNFPIADVEAGNFEGFAGSTCLSFERILALLLEKTKGNLPFWISPIQVKVLPLQKKHQAMAEEAYLSLKAAGFRSELFKGTDEIKTVLNQALEQGIPYVVVIGDKELESKNVTLRDVRAKRAQSLHLQDLIEMLKKELNGSNCSEL